jgi:recombination DNA repair RAD52 pathway protein
MNRMLLEQPFTPAQIKQRKGRNGVLDYVEGHAVIQRLNDALEGAWSFEIVGHEIREEEVLVVGRLTTGAVTKMALCVQ